MSRRILLYGEFWEGTHVDCVSKILNRKEIDNEIFNFYPILNKQFGNRVLNAIYRKSFYKENEIKINKELLIRIEEYKPDVLFISKGVNIFPETLLTIKKKSIIIINWNPDDFFNCYNSSKHIINSLPIYDYVFSARAHLFDEYRAKGIKNPIYLEWYYIHWLHKKPIVNLEIQKKITFVGTYSKRREKILDSIISRYPLEIWGDQWQFSKLKRKKNTIIHNKALTQIQFPEVMSQSLLNLNILTLENRDLTNLKIFEIPASYGIMLTEYTNKINEILNNNCFYFKPDISEDLSNSISKIVTDFNIDDLKYMRQMSHESIINGNNDISHRVSDILQQINFY